MNDFDMSGIRTTVNEIGLKRSNVSAIAPRRDQFSSAFNLISSYEGTKLNFFIGY